MFLSFSACIFSLSLSLFWSWDRIVLRTPKKKNALMHSVLKIEMYRALLARVNGWANASDSFQETFETAKYYLGERYEQRQAHLYRHIQALPHVQYAGKPTCKIFNAFIDKNYRGNAWKIKFLNLMKNDEAQSV